MVHAEKDGIMDISEVIGLEGGSDATWFKVLGEEGRIKTEYYPAVVGGKEKGWSDFDTLEEYMAAKVTREREAIRLTVAGNAVAAEDTVRVALGCHAAATGPTTVDVYPGTPDPFRPASAAAILGSSTSEAKSEAARRNGRKGGRPRKAK